MWKKIKKDFHAYMIRPMIYQCVTKICVGLLICLLWNRFINYDHARNLFEQAFFTVGIFFLILAWFQYLRMDGMKIHHLFEKKQKKKKKRIHWQGDIIDYADEKIISFAELDDEEQIVCRFLGDLICMLIFILPGIIAMIR